MVIVIDNGIDDNVRLSLLASDMIDCRSQRLVTPAKNYFLAGHLFPCANSTQIS